MLLITTYFVEIHLLFSDFFSVSEVRVSNTEETTISLFVNSSIDLSTVPLKLKVSFLGEESDLNLECGQVFLQSNELNEVILPISVNKASVYCFFYFLASIFCVRYF